MPDILGMDLSFLHNTGVGDVEIPVKDKKRLFYQDERKFAPPPPSYLVINNGALLTGTRQTEPFLSGREGREVWIIRYHFLHPFQYRRGGKNFVPLLLVPVILLFHPCEETVLPRRRRRLRRL